MKTALRIILPLLIVFGAFKFAQYKINNKAEPSKRQAPVARTFVDAVRLQPVDYPVVVRTQGTIQPRTESTLVPQVAGEVTEISAQLREGGFFEKGDTLLQIEKTDYQTAVTLAEAALAQAEVKLAEEQARGEQAKRDWSRLGGDGEPSPLVLRQPQQKEAAAMRTASKASLEKARRDLERTTIKAPYAGRVLEKMVDLGQFVSRGSTLARIYAIDYAEVELPVRNDQLTHLSLPEAYRGEQAPQTPGTKVILTATAGEREYHYVGRIVRTSGAIDRRSRQLSVVAQIDNPYGRTAGNQPPLKVGMFVTAEIKGQVLKNKIVIPRSALREGRDVLLIDEENKLVRTPVKILWGDEENIVVADGIAPGSVLCLTPVTYAVTGAAVVPDIKGEGVRDLNPPAERPASEPGKKGTGAKGKPGS